MNDLQILVIFFGIFAAIILAGIYTYFYMVRH